MIATNHRKHHSCKVFSSCIASLSNQYLKEKKRKKRKHFYHEGMLAGSINDGFVRWVLCLCCAALALCPE
jgi:hypothetical protein